MTAEQWVHTTLASKIVPYPSGDVIQLTETQAVEVTTFCQIFRTAIEDDSQPDKYVALSGSHTFLWPMDDPNATLVTRTSAEMGYQPYFDQWHAEGLF